MPVFLRVSNTRTARHLTIAFEVKSWSTSTSTCIPRAFQFLASHRLVVGPMEPMSATSTSAIGAAPPRTQTLSNKVQPLIPWRLRSHAAAEHSARQAACPRRITTRLQVVADRVTAEASVQATNHANQMVRDGHYESSLVAEQVNALRVRIACLDERDTIFLNPMVMNPRMRSRDVYDSIRMPD